MELIFAADTSENDNPEGNSQFFLQTALDAVEKCEYLVQKAHYKRLESMEKVEFENLIQRVMREKVQLEQVVENI